MNTQDNQSEAAIDDLIDSLFYLEDAVPRSIIDDCVRRGDEMEQALIALLDDEHGDDEFDTLFTEWPRLHAIMILGLLTTENAGHALVAALQSAANEHDDFLNDWLAGYWPALLRNKPAACIAELQKVADDKTTDEYLRIVSVEILLYFAQQQAGDALDRCVNWVASLAASEAENLEFRLMMACHLLEFPRNDHRNVAEHLAGRKCALGIMYNIKDVNCAYDEMHDNPEWNRFADPWEFYSPEAIAERRKRWEEELSEERLAGDDDLDDDFVDAPVTHARVEPKIGRNEPCPCGSGKKYKKCCLNRMQ
jgi:hypothetical protein